MNQLVLNITNKFEQVFKAKPQLIVRSPGRINLIGEHTDYNGGFVLPAAIDKAVYFAISPREDDECRFIAYDLDEDFTVNLNALNKTNTHNWANYLMGVLDEINKFTTESNRNPTSQIRNILRGTIRLNSPIRIFLL